MGRRERERDRGCLEEQEKEDGEKMGFIGKNLHVMSLLTG